MSTLPTYNTGGAVQTGASSVGGGYGLSSLLRLAFDIIDPVAYPNVLGQAQQGSPALDFSGIRTATPEELQTSHLGTHIMFPVTLKGGRYQRYDREGKIERVQLGDLRLPLSTVVEMGRTKEMTVTPVSSARSDVKEIYAHSNWQVTLSGIMSAEPGHPHGANSIKSQQERIQEFEDLADSIQVEAELLALRQVFRLTILSVRYPQISGKPGIIPFTIECLSDDPLELIIQ